MLYNSNIMSLPAKNPPLDSRYTIRRAQSPEDAEQLRVLFDDVFHPQQVGVLAQTLFHSFPNTQYKYWFIAEETKTGQVVSAFALIPWTLEMEGVPLKVAEMGIVGTLESHRGKGLFSRLSQDFDRVLLEEGFDFAMIQGIPGFYGQFGYSYAAPLEHHINLALHQIPDLPEKNGYSFRQADLEDIPFLIQQDEDYRETFSLATVRDADIWRYLLTDGLKTETGADNWIIVNRSDKFYFRIPFEGFGSGLILSEASERISTEALRALFGFCKQKALERDKPYIRLNMHEKSSAAQYAVSLGGTPGRPYAWQIKIPDPIHLLQSMKPLLEDRIHKSSFKAFSGTFRINFFRSALDLIWEDGSLKDVRPSQGEPRYSLAISSAMFPALCLGHRTWHELNYLHPDTYTGPEASALFVETLFPPISAWLYQQY